jgi:regulator of replication initiation timing
MNESLVENRTRRIRDLQKSNVALTKSKNEVSAVTKKLKKSEGDLKRALAGDSSARSTRSGASNNATKALKDQIANLKSKLKKMTDDSKGLITRNQILAKKLEEAYKELKKQGKSTSSEINAQVNNAARDYIKDVVFCTVKLVSSKKTSEVETFMRKVYDGIKHECGLDDNKSEDYLDFEDFCHIYQASLLGYLSTQPSNVQQACLKAVVGTYFTSCFCLTLCLP